MKFRFFSLLAVLALVLSLTSEIIVSGRRASGSGSTTRVTTTRTTSPGRTTVVRSPGISGTGLGLAAGVGLGAGIAAASTPSYSAVHRPVITGYAPNGTPIYGRATVVTPAGQPVVVRRKMSTAAWIGVAIGVVAFILCLITLGCCHTSEEYVVHEPPAHQVTTTYEYRR